MNFYFSDDTMKKKQLEMFLQQVPDFSKPKPFLEQYQTPATIASEVLFFAYQYQDIQDRIVVDLGCGTGIFSVGSAMLGAKKVIGIDTDADCISVAKIFANSHNLNNITFISEDVSDSVFSADTVIMNPPFGAQKGNIHADQVFLKKAIQNADVVYSLHLTKTLPHLKRFAQSLDAEIEILTTFNFPIKGQFEFHKKLRENVSVSCLRFVHSSAEKEEACK